MPGSQTEYDARRKVHYRIERYHFSDGRIETFKVYDLPEKGRAPIWSGGPVGSIDLDLSPDQDVKGATPMDLCDCAISRRVRRKYGIQEEGVRTGNKVMVILGPGGLAVRAFLDNKTAEHRKVFDQVSNGEITVWTGELGIRMVPAPGQHRIGSRKGTKRGTDTRNGEAPDLRKKPTRSSALLTLER